MQEKLLEEVGEEIFSLGLLFETDETYDTESQWVSYQHKLIHEFVAAKYIARKVEDDTAFLQTTFPSWPQIVQHQEVYKFCIGLSSNKLVTSFVDHV